VFLFWLYEVSELKKFYCYVPVYSTDEMEENSWIFAVSAPTHGIVSSLNRK
jgi:hypothetical protein